MAQPLPSTEEIRIAREADEYRKYMVDVFIRRGFDRQEAERKAEWAMHSQLMARERTGDDE